MFDSAFIATLRAIPSAKFSVMSSDKEQGTIQAARVSGAHEFATVFVMVHKEDAGVVIEAVFARNSGFVGGRRPEEWAQTLGNELKASLPDVTVEIVTKKK